MKKGPLIFTALMLSQWLTVAQIPPVLRLTNSEGNAFLSWSGVAAPVSSLQATASLLHPIIWNPLSWALGNGETNIPATNSQQYFRLTSAMPIFQFAIFYNVNLEIDPGNAMKIAGPVFCNQSIWEGSSIGIFTTNVTAVGTNCVLAADPFANNRTGTGNPTFLSAGQPESYAPPLALAGLGTNMGPAAMQGIVDLPPPEFAMGTAPAYSASGMFYLANAADLVISNAPFGTNFGRLVPAGTNLTIYYQDSATPSYLNRLTPDYYVLKTPYVNGGNTVNATNYVTLFTGDTNRCYTNVQYAGFSFVTNTAFYDYRESKMVQAVEIDISKFDVWMTNVAAINGGSYYNNLCVLDKGVTHPIDGIYVYNSVPETDTTLPAVRMVNGQVLASPAGLTVVTPFPMYVKGNYNVRTNAAIGGNDQAVNITAHTYPAALIADSITILSSNWNDSLYTSSYALALRDPVTTTINAGLLEGIVPSNTNIIGNYSGGVENFMRLEENWASPLWYNGAMVALFYSQYATNSWQAPGNYYQVPTRDWDFDSNFTNINKMPPLTPTVLNLVTP